MKHSMQPELPSQGQPSNREKLSDLGRYANIINEHLQNPYEFPMPTASPEHFLTPHTETYTARRVIIGSVLSVDHYRFADQMGRADIQLLVASAPEAPVIGHAGFMFTNRGQLYYPFDQKASLGHKVSSWRPFNEGYALDSHKTVFEQIEQPGTPDDYNRLLSVVETMLSDSCQIELVMLIEKKSPDTSNE